MDYDTKVTVIMPPTTTIDRDWRIVLDSLQDGTCAVLVGPGLSAGHDPDGTPCNLATDLSKRLAAVLKADHDLTVEDQDNLPLVAEFFEDETTRTDLRVEVRDFYATALRTLPHDPGADSTFATLASLPFPLYVTSRHDLVLEHYLQPRKPVVSCYDPRGNALVAHDEGVGTVACPLVYHLLGSIATPASAVLTEREMIALLRSIAAYDPPLPTDIASAFADKSFLFIGCGLHAYYTRVLLHLLKASDSDHRSFALDPIPPNVDRETFQVEYRRAVWFYQVGYKALRVLDSDERHFLKELRRLWDTEHRAPAPTPATTVAGHSAIRPLVFVSYTRGDKRAVRQLTEALHDHGIDTWYDESDLAAGDPWPDTTTDVIQNKAHFFIVLLSENLGEGDSYVHREIKVALERSDARGKLKFVYPVALDARAHLLDSLDKAKLHVECLDGLNELKVTALAKDIRREFQKLLRD